MDRSRLVRPDAMQPHAVDRRRQQNVDIDDRQRRYCTGHARDEASTHQWCNAAFEIVINNQARLLPPLNVS